MRYGLTNSIKWWIAGSRSIRNLKAVSMLLDKEVKMSDVIRTGGALGVDRGAEMWARNKGIKIEPALKPDWRRHGKGAGFKRNTEGVEWADKVIVVWDGSSRGSAHVIRECERLGKPLIRYVI